MDQKILLFFESLRSAPLDTCMGVLTWLGSEQVAIPLVCVILWCVNKTLGYRLGTALFFSQGINQTLKILFAMPRPWVRWPGIVHPVASAVPEAIAYSRARDASIRIRMSRLRRLAPSGSPRHRSSCSVLSPVTGMASFSVKPGTGVPSRDWTSARSQPPRLIAAFTQNRGVSVQNGRVNSRAPEAPASNATNRSGRQEAMPIPALAPGLSQGSLTPWR